MKAAIVADGNWLLWRAYSALGRHVASPTLRIPQLIMDWFCTYAIRLNCDRGAICFDGPDNYRKKVYAGYKLNRGGEGSSSDAVYSCLPPTQELFQAAGLPFLQMNTLEADDLMASGGKFFGKDQDIKTYLVCKDKDSYQNIRENVIVYTPEMKSHPEKYIDLEHLLKLKGFTPMQMRDYQILLGDEMDCVPPVRGFSPDKAKKLVLKHGSLGKFFKTKEGLAFYEQHEEELERNRILVGMKKDAWPERLEVVFNKTMRSVPAPYRDKNFRALANHVKNSGRSLF